jgi:hypothetical protein
VEGVDVDQVEGVHEGPPQEFGHQLGVEVLAAGDYEVHRDRFGMLAQLLLDGVKVATHVGVQAEVAGDLEEPLADQAERLGEVQAARGEVVDRVEQVGELGLGGGPFSRCGDDHRSASGVGVQDRLDAAKLGRIGRGTATKLADQSLARHDTPCVQ